MSQKGQEPTRDWVKAFTHSSNPAQWNKGIAGYYEKSAVVSLFVIQSSLLVDLFVGWLVGYAFLGWAVN